MKQFITYKMFVFLSLLWLSACMEMSVSPSDLPVPYNELIMSTGSSYTFSLTTPGARTASDIMAQFDTLTLALVDGTTVTFTQSDLSALVSQDKTGTLSLVNASVPGLRQNVAPFLNGIALNSCG